MPLGIFSSGYDCHSTRRVLRLAPSGPASLAVPNH